MGFSVDVEASRGVQRNCGLTTLTAHKFTNVRMNAGLLTSHSEQTFLRDQLLTHKTGRSL